MPVNKKTATLKQVAVLRFYSAGVEGGAGGTSAAASAGFFFSVTKPTITGTRIMRNDRHRNTYPYVGGMGWAVSPSVNVPFPVIVPNPKMQANRAQHPQSIAVTMVAIIPVFLLFIFSPFSLSKRIS